MDQTQRALELIRSCNGPGGALWVAAMSKNDPLFARIKELAFVTSGPCIVKSHYITRELFLEPA